LLGDWWIIVAGAAIGQPQRFVMLPDEVLKRAVPDKNKAQAWWLPTKAYQTDEFRDRWDRVGLGNATLDSGREEVDMSPE
jgi:hypothetical protein